MIPVRCRLAGLDVFGNYKDLRRWQLGGAEAERREGLRARCHNGPSIRGHTREEFPGAGHDGKPFDILQLRGIEPVDLRVYRKTRKYLAQAIPHLTPVGNSQNGLGVEVMPLCPTTPHAFRDGVGIDQDTVQVEEECVAPEFQRVATCRPVATDDASWQA